MQGSNCEYSCHPINKKLFAAFSPLYVLHLALYTEHLKYLCYNQTVSKCLMLPFLFDIWIEQFIFSSFLLPWKVLKEDWKVSVFLKLYILKSYILSFYLLLIGILFLFQIIHCLWRYHSTLPEWGKISACWTNNIKQTNHISAYINICCALFPWIKITNIFSFWKIGDNFKQKLFKKAWLKQCWMFSKTLIFWKVYESLRTMHQSFSTFLVHMFLIMLLILILFVVHIKTLWYLRW